MRTLFLAALLGCFAATSALADSCVAAADAKKLAGAARTSFLGKCQRDVQVSCSAQAADKKLHGAAETSYVGKCVKDAVGQ